MWEVGYFSNGGGEGTWDGGGKVERWKRRGSAVGGGGERWGEVGKVGGTIIHYLISLLYNVASMSVRVSPFQNFNFFGF